MFDLIVSGTRTSDVVPKLMQNGVPVNPKEIEIIVKDDKIVVTFKKPTRESSGGYDFSLSNSQGESKTPLKFNFVDVPSPPEGPLEVTDLFRDRCKLAWKPPKDLGGLPLLHYVVERQDLAVRGGWTEVGTTESCKMDVTDLAHKKEYKFRVRAVNKKGTSEPLTAPKTYLAKDPYDEPSKPKDLEIVDWDKDHVDLKWKAPEKDGGAPIEKYVVESKDKFSPDWVPCLEVSGNELKGKVTAVKENMQYQFRVRAINKAGPGEPSDPTKNLIVKARFAKPFIIGEELKNVVVKKGAIIKYDIQFGGEPPPDVVWTINSTELKPSSRISIENTPKTTLLIIKQAVRGDSGKITLTLTNSSGSVSSTADVVVLDKPTPPEGPLIVEEIFAESAKLKWKQPKDLGGSELKGYQIEKMDVDTGRWVPCGEVGPNATSFKCEGLTKGKKYKFRVKALNKEGESDPLETDQPITAKNPYDEPSKPGKPDIVDYDNTSVSLKWAPPEKDGGRPIERYIVEMKDKFSSDWKEVLKTEGPTPEATVKNLNENSSVQFRVRAVNLAGPGEPSDATDQHIVKHRNLKPYIDRTNLKNIIIKSGRTHKYDVDIRGEPPPTVVWTFGESNVKLSDDINIKIENRDYHSELTVSKATRKQSGKYTITATNKNGTDSVVVDLTVLAAPSKPEGPLEVTDIHKEGCKLKWKKPKDDGGSPIKQYDVEKFDKETGRWTRCGKTDKPEIDVTGLTPGKEYLFRVTAVNEEGDSEPLTTLEAIIAKNPYDEPTKPGTPEIIDYDNTSVELKWTPPKSDGGAPIQKYIIEKKEKNALNWEKAAEVIGNVCEGKVEELKERTEVQFRVVAVNKAGPSEPSDATKNHVVKHRRLKPYIDRTNLEMITVKRGKQVKLDVNVRGEPPPAIAWKLADKEVKGDENYEIVNVDYNTKFTINDCQRKHTGLYKIIAVNEVGKDEAEVEICVLCAPSRPKGPLKVDNVTAKQCDLHWQKPDDDGGRPIQGYAIEKLDPLTGNWVPCGRTDKDTTDFQVTGLQQGKCYQFRVKAINSEGESEPLVTTEPIVAKNPYESANAPSKPDIVDWDEKHVDLVWKPPKNDGGAPITGYIVEVKDKLSSHWEPVLETNSPKPEATVAGLIKGKEYQFRVKAVNKAGPGEASEPTGLHTCKERHLKPHINRDNLQPITIRAGNSAKVDVEISGEPPPKVEWIFAGKPLEADLNTKIENPDYESHIQLKNMTRKQTGKYKIVATNESGKDEAEVEINVLDKPGKPEGPLDVSDVHANGCTLDWNPPKDDGGVPLQGYVVEKKDISSGRWVPVAKVAPDKTTVDVTGLDTGKKYEFRVKAVNEEGESEPLDTDRTVLAKNPFEEPGAPGLPTIEDYDKDFVELKWEAPIRDGGAPITGYIIEKKDKYSHDFVPAAEIQGNICKGKVTGLNEGDKYEFRVRAVNKAGPGAPSDSTAPHLAKPRFLKPKIDRTNLKPITIKAGQMVMLDVNVSGEPPPTIVWKLKDKELSSGETYAIDNIDYNTKFNLLRATRKETGTYTIIATNSSGTDEATVEVNVLGKPSKPNGPLEVTDVHKEGCKLKWKPPDDDGGTPIECYEVEKMDEETGRWVPCGKSKEPSIEVTNLVPGRKYKFRVRAVNKEGDSDELETDHSTVAKNPFDEPSKPGRPEPTDWDKDHVDLTWSPPDSDGGAPIEGYIIEKRKKGQHKWQKAKTLHTPDTKATVPDLEEGEEYEFRVIAVNKAGPSEPSDASRSVIAKPRRLAPIIDRTNLKNITIRSGQPVKFDVDVKGEPPPTIEWTFNGEKLKTDDNHSIDNEPNHTLFILSKSKRNDTGNYVITAKNEFGSDEAVVEVKVLSKPGKPKGPLQVNDVHAEGCKLKWEKPEDDGGEPISGYVVEKMDVDTGRWVPVTTVREPEAEVKGLIAGKEYKFRVKAVNSEGESEPLESDLPVVAKNPFDEPGKPGKPSAKDWDKHHVDLTWKAPDNDGGAPITSYIIEKKDKYSTKWQKAAEVIGDKCEARVAELIEGMEYQFRVKAVNKAGPGAPSDASDSITAKPRNLAPKIDRSTLRDVVLHAGQTFKFDVKVIGEPPPKTLWFANDTPIKNDSQHTVENEPYRTKLAVSGVERKDTGVYKITAENPSGKDEAEVKVTVLDVPSPPEGPLEVTDVHAEGCKLKWKEPKDDGGVPIESYVVEKQDTQTGRWVPVGSTTRPEIAVNNLEPGKEYKFRVKAINAEGESLPLETLQPIVAKNPFDPPGAPGTPEMTNYDKDFVELKWQKPIKDGGAPITGYIIEVKEKDGTRWVKGATIDGDVTSGKVPDLVEGETYQFRVKAVNAAGPGEASDASKGILVKPRKLPPKIDRRNLINVSIKAGQTFSFDVNVKGEPAPETVWKIKDKTVVERPTLHVEDKPYNTKLICDKAERKDSAIYHIIATNQWGRDEAEVEVIVVSKPDKPEGPLEVSDVNKNGCHLKWKKPKDDGGEPLDGYIVEKLEPETGAWVPIAKTHLPETDVTGLTPGKSYQFRVKAVNKEGESEPLETDFPIVAKDPFDTPGQPGKPEATDWNKDHVDLKWTPPISDGGAPITSYIIEKKEKGSPKWIKAAEVAGDQTKGTAPHLEEGKEYEFRVTAVNKAGPGEPMAPHIDRKNLNDITLRVGQAIKFDVDVTGEPPPTIVWHLNEEPIKGDQHIKVDNEDYNTKLTARNSTRADSGKYVITATNSSGRDQATVNVLVIDKPTPPEGPLDVSDVHKEGCKLKWKPPKDDGGIPLEGYLVEKLDTDSGIWVPVGKCKEPQMDVTGLTPGKEYKFRVAAVNKEGESEPLEALKPIIAKNPFDEPGKPGTPEATDWDKDHVDLKWTPPASDGGAPITGYIIEKKDKWGDWEKAVEVPGDKTTATVPGLIEGQPYEFRVKAVNKAGPGEPSDASKTIVAKPRRLAPKIDRNALNKVKIKAGQTFNFDVNVIGEPPPDITWTLKGRKVTSGDKIKLVNEPYNTKLNVRQATRADSGTYTITAVNENGKDEATVEVLVLDRPAPPEGPLKIDDIHAEGCTLKWKPPEDDGGAPIDHYVVEKQDPLTGVWVPVEQTIGPETQLKVKGLQPNKKYKFRVKAVNRLGDSDPLNADKEILAKNPFDEPGKPGTPVIDDYDKDFVKLKWKEPESDGGSPITGYVIEKKDKYNPDWVPVAEVVGNVTTGKVPDLVEGNQYEFRVRAVNKGGPGVPSDSTGTHTARPKNAPPKIDRNAMRDIKVKKGKTIEIEVPVTGEPPPTKKWALEGLPVSEDSRWSVTNEDYKTKLVIKNAERGDSGVLTLTATNINGTDSATLKINVLDVPKAPENMRISDITKESCVVAWSPPKDDGGSEISHYVVEKKDIETGRWIPVGEAFDNKMKVDKLLDHHEYQFRVKAVNKEGESPYLTGRDTIVAKNPFETPDKPSPPQIADWDKDHVDLEWKPPRRDGGAPITGYIIEKKLKSSPFWEEALRVAGDITKGTVPHLTEGEEYEFRITAVNKAGASEPSEPSESVVCKPRKLAPSLDTSALKNLKVRAGRPINYTIPIKGEPAPTATWTINGKSVANDNRMDVSGTAGQTILDIPTSVRSDSGTFTLTLENPYGKVSASATVTVLDRPSPPEGPINIKDITKESCHLSWKEPKDDGGAPIKHYLIEKMDTARGSWVECGTTPNTNFKVTKLQHKKSYNFRIIAVNEMGDSDALESDHPIVAKNPYDVADAPGRPNVVDWDKDHVDLEWTAPKDDGGSPITGYIIQKKEKGSPFWSKAITVPAGKTKATVPDLKEGQEYEFRVIATNKAGESEPSEPSDLVTCRPRNLAPKILTPMKEVRVKVGQKLNVEIKFIGAPVPQVDWTLNGKPLKSDNRATVSDFDDHTIINIVDAKRSDSGSYTLKLENINGKDEGTMAVIVLDKPGAPEGPLNIDSVDKDRVDLSWRPPKDDGGSEITGYVVEKRDKTTGGQWGPAVLHVSPKATECTVPKLIEGHEYEFRVMAENAQGLSEPLKTDRAVKAKAPYGVPQRPGQPEVVDSDRDFIKIKWAAPRNDGGSPITGYDVERKDLKGNRWLKVNREPVRGLDYTDDSVTDGHLYEYRVVARNAAGVSEPSPPSKAIAAKPLKEKPKLHLDGLYGRTIRVRAGDPLVINIPLTGAPQPEVVWSVDDSPLKPSNRVITENKDEMISLKIPVSQRGDTGKYTIKATNPYGEDSADIQVLVYNQPSPPRGPLEYQSVTNSTVTLNWKTPEDDGGSEIIGYSVEKCEFGSDKWIPAGYSTGTVHTAKNLEEGKQYKFRVRAENMYGISEPLDGRPVVAKNPFDTPDAPGQPQIEDYGPTFAAIKWTPPLSDGGRPIQGYIVEKREKGSPDWVAVNSLPTHNTEFTIPNLTEGQSYEFRVIAVNEGGKGKPSKPSATMTAKERKFPPDAPDMPRVEKITKTGVTLSWKKPLNDGGSRITGYLVEKKPKGAKDWEIVNKFPTPDTTYGVQNLIEGNEYEFRIIAVNDIGDSPPSRPCPMVKVEDQPNKPKIDVGAVRDITVKAGQDFSINVPFTAFPKPTANWSVNNNDIDSSDSRFMQKTSDDYTQLVCTNSKREYTGKYSLLLKNSCGFDTVTCNVRVLDRPSPPQNVRGEDVEGDSLTLKWSPPKDDGGSEVTNYVVERRESGSNAWTRVSSFANGTALRVRNLTVGRYYDFRVMAENQYGTSDPAQTDESILAKLPFDTPDAPGIPRAIDTSEDSITLTWTKPRSDGGSPITGYVLEKRKVGDKEWARASPALITDLTYKVPGLKNNEEYEFRVAATNAAGQGPFSYASDAIIVRRPPSAPKIDGDFALKDIVVMAGEQFTLRVPFNGSPTPKAEWTINGKTVIPDDRITSEVNVAFTVLLNKKAKREDSGKYGLKLTNSEGSDSAFCRVQVVDVPEAPQGPLEVSDITPEMCSLAWRPPLDDGGSPITNYIVEKQDQTTKIWTKLSAFVRGCHYDVIGLQPNKTYHFRVSAENQYGVGKALETDKPITAKFPFNVPDPPGKPTITDYSKNTASLSWERPLSDGGSKIQGYSVEYKEPSDSKWLIGNEFTIKNTTFTVNGLIENKEYQFRIKAKNAAGWSKPSPHSATIKMKGKFAVPSPPQNLHVKKVGKTYVDLKWEAPRSDGGSKITGYIVERKEHNSTYWIKVNDYGCLDCEYTVLNLSENNEYDFKVSAVNSAGKSEPCLMSTSVKVQEIAGGSKPEFVRKLFNKNTNLKSQITLECEAMGNPLPNARWFKNGKEIHAGGRLKATEEDGVFKLIFTEVWDTDEADYTCEAVNPLGSDKTSASLRIAAPPQIIRCPNEVYFPEKDNGKIKIFFSGSAPFDVMLFKEGLEVKESDHLKYTVFDEYVIIFIRDVVKSDEAKYKVIVKNESGQADATFAVFVTGLPGKPTGPLEVPEISKNSATITWKAPKYDGGCKVTHYIVERKESSHTQWVTATSFCKETIFTAQGLTEGGEYLFRVMAVNENGQSEPLVGENPIIAKLPFDKPSAPGVPEVTEVGGDFVNLHWEKPESDGGSRIQGYIIEKREVGTVAWQRVNVSICHSTQINISNLIEDRQYEFRDGDTYTLTISDVYGEDADEYACRAVNKGGARTSREELVIKTAPKISVPPRFRDMACFERGENVSIKIPFTGNPKPRIKWSKEGEEIERGDHFDVIVKERHAILVIRDVSKLDSGPYCITAENELGVDSATINVQISDRPDPPRFPIVEQVGDEYVTLSWKAPLWDGGSTITNYIIEKKEPSMSSWVRCGHTRFLLHQITGLNPNKDYEFRVFAENVYGRSEPSETTQKITTKPSEKDKHKRKGWEFDAMGRKIRGKPEGKVTNYDQFVSDAYQSAQPVDIKTSSVYDFYDILEEIGTGAFGVVHRCREKKTGHIFAAKFIPVSHPLEKSIIRKEIDIMNHLHHAKLIRLHDAFEDDDEMVLIYEFMSGGELFERITDEGYKMSEAEAQHYVRQIIEGVRHMHEKNIIHLDLKPENIMCQKKNSNNIKIIDFGLATKLDPHEIVKISTGTAEFAAPEIVEREPVGFYTDMWAVGVLSYVLLSGLSPFAGENDIETLKNVKACDWDFDEEKFRDVSNEAKDFIRHLLTRNKDKRMTAHECLEHDWLKGTDVPTTPIPNRNYINIRDKTRAKYDTWMSALVPIGHIANYSSLRKLQDEKYKMQEVYFDRREAVPRFVIKPHSTFAYEGQAAKFTCRIDEPVRRRREEPLPLWEEPKDCAPHFTFLLRPRVIQVGLGVKLLCCLNAKPWPEIRWFKDGRELSKHEYTMSSADGVCTLDITSSRVEDAGKYTCLAVNHLGEAETSCNIIIEAKRAVPHHSPSPVVISPPTTRISTPTPRSPVPPLDTYIRDYKAESKRQQQSYSSKRHDSSNYSSHQTYSSDTSSYRSSSLKSSSKYQSNYSSSKYKSDSKTSAIGSGSSSYSDSKRSVPLSSSPTTPTTPGGSRRRQSTKEIALEKNDFIAPEFTDKLKDLKIKDGESLTLKAVVKGDPEPQIQWLKNGKPLSSSDIIDLKYKNGVASLNINEVFPEDEGDYECIATNSEGKVSTKCKLTIIRESNTS
ncbi:unnamed protein product [Oppiella nova]|uniref:non-specific serine/threonine protein kinase n=1 Tax=Oppiella nova TaxID=334625 RepID=A0A7R9QB47_9ACAR|nr:unnamed protein product [Oppiella nova]CAG2161698.1 unnamed protein product [Oppiella nova]